MRLPPARATNAIALLTLAVFGLVTVTGHEQTVNLLAGFIPARVSGLDVPQALPVWITPLTATLLHGSVMHAALNLVMLLFCGRMVEAVLGPLWFSVLYVVGAYAAAAGQFIAGPLETAQMIGASGAISAVFGAYALLYGRPRGFPDHPRLGQAVNILWLAAAWIGVQFLTGVAFSDMGMAIATAAHVGGFLAGLALIRPLMMARHAGQRATLH